MTLLPHLLLLLEQLEETLHLSHSIQMRVDEQLKRIEEWARALQRGERGEVESVYSTIDEVASQSGSSYAAVADIAGAVLPETASPMAETLESMYSNLNITRVP